MALGAGSALPQSDDGGAGGGDVGSSTSVAANARSGPADIDNSAKFSDRQAAAQRASRSQTRAAMPAPKQLPDWARPAQGPISSTFGVRWGVPHKGVDIAAAYGSTVRAARDGVIEKAGWYGGYGYIVIINHGNGMTTRYGHNSVLSVSEGQRVQAGDKIAEIGSTGDSTGPHCHFEIRFDGEAVDPLAYFDENGIDVLESSGVNTSY